MRGYTPDEIKAVPVDQALTPEAASELIDLIHRRVKAFQTGKTPSDKFYTDEVEQPCKDGSTVWTEVITNYYINPENNKVEIRGVTRDITDRKQAENETKRLQAQLLQSHKMESIGTLAGGIAVDCRVLIPKKYHDIVAVFDDLEPGSKNHRVPCRQQSTALSYPLASESPLACLRFTQISLSDRN